MEARLRDISGHLPEGSATYYLECRLNHDPQVDLEVGFPFPDYQVFLPAVKSFGQVPFVMLEADHVTLCGGRPGLLICLDRRMGIRASGHAVPDLNLDGFLEAARQGSRAWLHAPLSRPLQATMSSCFSALPRGGRILHLSLMPSRHPPILKLNLVLPKTALFGFLRKVGWPGDAKGLRRLWTRLNPFCRLAKVDLTLQNGVQPTLGFELFPSNSTLEGRRKAVRWLHSRGLGIPGKCSEISSWHGSLWRSDKASRRVFHFGLDFGIKIVLDGAASWAAKGYLQIHPQAFSIA